MHISQTHLSLLDREQNKPSRVLFQQRLLEVSSLHLGLLVLAHHHLSAHGIGGTVATAKGGSTVIRGDAGVGFGRDGVGSLRGEGLDRCDGRSVERVEVDALEFVDDGVDSHGLSVRREYRRC